MKMRKTGKPRYLLVRYLSMILVLLRRSCLLSFNVSLSAPEMKPYRRSVITVSRGSEYSFSRLLYSFFAMVIISSEFAQRVIFFEYSLSFSSNSSARYRADTIFVKFRLASTFILDEIAQMAFSISVQ